MSNYGFFARKGEATRQIAPLSAKRPDDGSPEHMTSAAELAVSVAKFTASTAKLAAAVERMTAFIRTMPAATGLPNAPEPENSGMAEPAPAVPAIAGKTNSLLNPGSEMTDNAVSQWPACR